MPRTAAKPIALPHPAAPLIVSAHEAQISAALHKHEAISRTNIARLTGWSRPEVTAEAGRLATRELIVSYSPLGGEARVTGAIHLALEHLSVVQDKSSGV